MFTGPAVTALGLAASRTVETGRPDRLIEDPLARRLYLAAGADLPMLLDWPESGDEVTPAQAMHLHGSRYIGLRARFYDDLLVEDTAAAGLSQGVLLGAGLDTRAYRLPLPPGFRLFELDQSEVLSWKREVLAPVAEPGCRVADVGIDLRHEWSVPLGEAGFDSASPAVFIAEGLLAYLSAEEQLGLVDRVSAIAAPASRLALDRILGDPHADGRVQALSERSGIDMASLMAAGDGAGLPERLRSHGWSVEEEAVGDVAGRYGRDLGDPFGGGVAPPLSGEPPWLDTVFVTARRD